MTNTNLNIKVVNIYYGKKVDEVQKEFQDKKQEIINSCEAVKKINELNETIKSTLLEVIGEESGERYINNHAIFYSTDNFIDEETNNKIKENAKKYKEALNKNNDERDELEARLQLCSDKEDIIKVLIDKKIIKK